MEFFDRKSEVIDIKLTEHGKKLWREGKFKPVYYFFSDDDILYDAGFASGSIASENQNLIVPRIEEQPHFKSLPMRTEMAVLGDSDPNSVYAPSWTVKALQGKIEAVTHGSQDNQKNFADSLQHTRIDFESASCVVRSNATVVPASVVLEIEERNAPSGTEMFDLEIAMFVESPDLSGVKSKEGQFVPLFFVNSARSEVIDDLLVEYDNLEDIQITEKNVEKYLDVKVDGEAISFVPPVMTLQESAKAKEAFAKKVYLSNITPKDVEEQC